MSAASAETDGRTVTLTASRHFTGWLAEQNAGIAFSTYRGSKLFLAGVGADGRLSVFERTFPRCMALHAEPGGVLYVSSLFQIWRLVDCLGAGEQRDGYDALYVPRVAHTTGDLDVHEVTRDRDGRLLF